MLPHDWRDEPRAFHSWIADCAFPLRRTNDWDKVRGISVLTKLPIEQRPLQPKARRTSRDHRKVERGFAATMSYAAVNTATLVDRAASR
jgi:hypothetical protein